MRSPTNIFIADALYNPHYGYFSKEAVIFQAGEPFDFNSYQDALAFHKAFGDRYTEFEDKLDAIQHNELRQLWHTPTELFQPYYGEAVARYLVANYKLSLYPYHDLILYEMGAGNGTLMRNIMDCIRRTDPDVYQRTQYKIIEISPQLAALQRAKVGEHEDHVEIVNRSIFDWNVPVHNPVYFIAMEVFDNFAHDMLRYDPFTEKALQGIVLIDDKGDFYEFYTPQLDPVADRYLRLRKSAFRRGLKHPLNTPRFIRNLRTKLPFHSNLTEPEFIPTALMSFFDVLRNYFPNHRLLASDFHSLPDAVEGVNAPVVQTRYQRTMVPVSTVFVEQGYFDILFPTDFEAMEDMYQALTGKLTRVMKHEEFAKSWADLEATETRSGENPLLQYYQNASVLSSV